MDSFFRLFVCLFLLSVSGCGNSSLSEDMYRDGFHNITNIDYSSVVVDNMKNRSAEARSMRWLVMDIKDLKFESGSFDIVIEKATLDALLVAERDPWRLSDESRSLMDHILLQVGNLFSFLLLLLSSVACSFQTSAHCRSARIQPEQRLLLIRFSFFR